MSKDWWPRARPHPSGAQLPKQGRATLVTLIKNLLHSPIPKGLHNGNSSLLLNLVLPNCFVCFGPRLHIRNDKSASFKLKARQLQCQCQHDRVLVATGGRKEKRGRRELCTSCWASRNRVFLSGWSPGSSHRIFNLLQVDKTGRVALAAVTNQTCSNYSYNIKMERRPWKQLCAFDMHSVLI